jgi:hypothetical protein
LLNESLDSGGRFDDVAESQLRPVS